MSRALATVLCLLTCHSAVAQETLSTLIDHLRYEERKSTVLFDGKRIPIEQYLLLEKAIDLEKNKWLRKTDPQSKLSLAEHERLSSNSITLCVTAKGKTVRINSFGISALPFMLETRQTKWSQLVNDIEGDLVAQTYEYGDLADELVRLRSKINLLWKKLRRDGECGELVVRATLKDHWSIQSGQNECWLLFDLYPADKGSENMFLADLRKRLSSNTPIEVKTHEELPQYVAPHPELAEIQFDLVNAPKLAAGRNGSPKVVVEADGQTNAKREDLYNFVVNDSRNVKQHQVESISVELVDGSGSWRDAPFKMGSLVFDRIKMGSVFNFNELHLILGNVSKEMGEAYPGCFCVFTLKDGLHGIGKNSEISSRIEILVGKE